MAGNNVRIGTQVTGVGKASSDLDNLKDKFTKLRAEGAKGVGIGVGAAVTAKGLDLIGGAALGAGRAIGDFINDSIEAASELRESTSLTGQVFEDNAGKIETWAAGAADAFGESKAEAQSFAAEFGTAFKNVGMSLDDTTKKAEEMTHLAADLGSAFDRSSEEAATALRSGLLGESEPLRAFGVFLDEAKVKAKAAAMGMEPLNGALSDGQKVAARYALIMEQTADSQGMFGRDTGSLADAQKRANAELRNAEAELGTKLLPIQLEFTKAMLAAVPVIEKLADGLGGLAEVAGVVGEGLDGIGDVIGFLQGGLPDAINGLDNYEKGFKRLPAAVDDASASMTGFAGNAGKAADDTTTAGQDIARQMGTTASAVVQSFHRMSRASHTFRDGLLTDAQRLVDDYFDVIIAKDDLAATNAEIDAIRRKVANGKATKDDIDRLHKLERTQFEIMSDLAEHGKLSDADVKKSLGKLYKRLKTAHGDEKRLVEAEIDALERLQQAAKDAGKAVGAAIGSGLSGIISNLFPQHHAAGGRYAAGVPRIVGELGPELDIPDHSGTIIPNNQLGGSSGGGGGGGGFYPIAVPANWSPAQQQAFAREAAPYMIRELRRQKVIA